MQKEYEEDFNYYNEDGTLSQQGSEDDQVELNFSLNEEENLNNKD